MTNGDMFVPDPPPFKIYQTEISYGCDNQRVTTDILGIKCSIEKARLLKEFYSQIANPMEMEKRSVCLSLLEPSTSLARKHTRTYCAQITNFCKTLRWFPWAIFSMKRLRFLSQWITIRTSTKPTYSTLSMINHGALTSSVHSHPTKSFLSPQKASSKQHTNGQMIPSLSSTTSTYPTKSTLPHSDRSPQDILTNPQ